MIVRIWRGTATAEKAVDYERHFVDTVVPELRDIPGHRGASLLRREAGGAIEFLAVTLWESIDAVKAFAGANPDVAVVEPAAVAALSQFDDFVRHYELVCETRSTTEAQRSQRSQST
jgi:heme-degrading monooxygenase HmoA